MSDGGGSRLVQQRRVSEHVWDSTGKAMAKNYERAEAEEADRVGN